MAIGTYVSMITLNAKGINILTKRHKLDEWVQNGKFFRRDHILGHKSSISKYLIIEIVFGIFSDHNAETIYQLQEKNVKKKHKEGD